MIYMCDDIYDTLYDTYIIYMKCEVARNCCLQRYPEGRIYLSVTSFSLSDTYLKTDGPDNKIQIANFKSRYCTILIKM